jgi:hypothetical protein
MIEGAANPDDVHGVVLTALAVSTTGRENLCVTVTPRGTS